jgi:hypothetical protein
VSRETVVAAKKVLQDGAPELAQAVEAGTLTVSAAVPLTVLPREDQLTALQEAQHEATGKKTTAKQTRAVVRRRQAATTVTPERDGHLKAAEVARAALPTRLSQLCDLLAALATFPVLEQLLLDISPDCYDRVDHDLDTAFETLSQLRTLWKTHRHEDVCHLQDTHKQTSPVREVSAEPQQLSQPAQASRDRETGQAQRGAETEDAIAQTEKTGADYDTTRFYLGKLCPRAHTYRDTGQTLRRQRKGDCVQCHRAS